MENQEKTRQKLERDEKGRLLPHQESLNPDGRPKGSISIVSRLKAELEKIPVGQKISYLEALIKMILKKALAEEDKDMIKTIIQYVDGMPKQPIEMDIDQRIEKIDVEIIEDRKIIDINIIDNENKRYQNIQKELQGISEGDKADSQSGRQRI